MKLSFYACVTLSIAFCLCHDVGTMGQSFTMVSNTNCFCPAVEMVVYRCTTSGPGRTRYRVTGCAEEQLQLLHTDFANGSTSGPCTNVTLGLNVTARSISSNGGFFTSDLTLTVPNARIMVECFYEDGINPNRVGDPFILTPAVPHVVGNIHFTKFGSIHQFSWNGTSAPAGCQVEYSIVSENCGMCPSTSAVTYVSCPYEQAPTQRDCNLTVSMRVCGNSGSPTTEVFRIPPGPTTPTPPVTNNNAPSSGGTNVTTIVVVVCVTLAVIVFLIAVTVAVVICRGRSQVRRKPESERLLQTVTIKLEEFKHSFEAELERKNQVIEEKKQKITENEGIIRQNEEELRRVEKERDDFAAEKTCLIQKVNELRDKNTQLEATNKSLQKEVETLKNTIENEQKEREKEMNDLRRELQSLNNAKASEADVQKLQQQVEALQQKVSSNHRNHNELQPQDQKYKDLGVGKYQGDVYQQLATHVSQVAFEKGDTYRNGSDHASDRTQQKVSDDNNESSSLVAAV